MNFYIFLNYNQCNNIKYTKEVFRSLASLFNEVTKSSVNSVIWVFLFLDSCLEWSSKGVIRELYGQNKIT